MALKYLGESDDNNEDAAADEEDVEMGDGSDRSGALNVLLDAASRRGGRRGRSGEDFMAVSSGGEGAEENDDIEDEDESEDDDLE